MTRDETKTVLATMSAVYSKNLLPDVTELTVNVWFQLLQDLPYNLISAAVMGWMQTNQYPPTVAGIRELVMPNNAMQPEEAWGKIQEAALRYGHTQPKEAEMFLGSRIWTIVNRFGWQYFCMMPIDEESTYYAQFRNAYNDEQRKTTEQARLSPSVVAILAGNIIKQMGSGVDG